MEDGVELLLKVDAFAQAVGANQDLLPMLCQGEDTVLSLLGRQQAGDGGDLDILDGLAEGCCHVLGRVDEPAENDRRKRK